MPNPNNGQPTCRLDCTSCGDGVVDPNDQEVCDDGNTVSGCNPQLPQKPLDGCLNNCRTPICSDPGKIAFGNDGDSLKVHGRLITDQTLDLSSQHFVVQLTHDSTVIFRASLLAGSIEQPSVRAFRYRTRDKTTLPRLAQLKALGKPGYYKFTLKAYGDMRDAVADMTTYIYIGTDEWVVRAVWVQTARGWKLNKHGTFLQP
jgi:hypothetical protein